MALQLRDAPQAVYRQAAVAGSECPDLQADKHSFYGDHDHVREKSLFCSNYKIWQHANSSEADFIIVMEDDVVLQPSFWNTTYDFLMACPHFDYVTMDSWKESSQQMDAVDICHASLFRPAKMRPVSGYWGSQVQVVRITFLNTLIQRAKIYGMGPLDVWWQMHVNDGRAFSWQPGIAPQAGRQKGGLPRGCSNEIARSDISPKDATSLLQAPAQDVLPRLQCMRLEELDELLT
eukprot:CAMPEP_0115481496 /NCGR_PEP_ID=MMETSP0271-20121206/57828_1 /TAXON_ID=71861 /ORGANISM="Scrippsiella trochoidea, Strain CCMP3099" /LENGTH=233 /DNA_ID=CAMNT_0002909233 /DNA_START=192 /DNA_END=893 /DNA_ORIENTATION=+